jgi:uncharacterized protein (DUF1330 family)
MRDVRTYVVAWAQADSPAPGEPLIEELRVAAHRKGGALLACGGARDVVETDARPVPSWLAIAGFSADEAAKSWVTLAENHLPDTALLVPGHAEPVEWPPEHAVGQPEWSRRGQPPPPDRLGWLVSVWLEVQDFEGFLTYSTTFKWTVEQYAGTVLGSGIPTIVQGSSGPSAMGLMAFRDRADALAWYASAEYRPYWDLRHASSRATAIAIPAVVARQVSTVELHR